MKKNSKFVEKIWFPTALLYILLLIVGISFIAFNIYEFLLTVAIGVPCSLAIIYLLIAQSNYFLCAKIKLSKLLVLFISRYFILIFTFVAPALIIYLLKGNVLFFLINVGIILYIYLILVLNKKYLAE